MKYYCVHQHDDRDCAAACVSTIAKDYGYVNSLSFFRELTKTTSQGANIYGIVDALSEIGFKSNAYRIDTGIDQLSTIKSFPFIARIINEYNLFHFVVINKISNNRVFISDPGKGKHNLKIDDFLCVFTGYIITAEPKSNNKSRKYSNPTKNLYKKLLQANKRCYFLVCILSFVIAGIGVLTAYGIKYEFEVLENQEILESKYGVITEETLETLHEDHETGMLSEDEYLTYYYMMDNVIWLRENFCQLVTLLIVCGISKIIFSYIQGLTSVHLFGRYSLQTTDYLCKQITELKQSQLDSWKSGELTKRYEDAETVSTCFITTITSLIVNCILLIVGGYILYIQSTILFIVVILSMLLYVLIMALYINPIKHSRTYELEKSTQKDSFIKEMVDSIFDIKLLSFEKTILDILHLKNDEYVNAYKKTSAIELRQGTMVSFVSAMMNIALITTSFYLIANNKLSIGTFIAFFTLIDYFVSPIESLVDLQGTIQAGKISYNRLQDILNLEPVIKADNPIKTSLSNELCVKDITFRYGNEIEIFKDLNLSIIANKHNYIQGGNGIGKSTLAKLLAGIYLPESGNITWDGVSIDIDNISILKDNVIYVPETSNFLSLNVIDNLKSGINRISIDEIQSACQLVGLDKYIKSKPQQYEYPLDEQGKNLSSGQRQRLAIARAILHNPSILILDEATSNIDQESEALIYKKLREKYKSMTIITISHNLNNLIPIDNIVQI